MRLESGFGNLALGTLPLNAVLMSPINLLMIGKKVYNVGLRADRGHVCANQKKFFGFQSNDATVKNLADISMALFQIRTA